MKGVIDLSYMTNIYQADIPHRAISVYVYLQSRANKENTCFPSVATISADTKLSKSTVKRAIKELVQYGLLAIEHRFRKNGAKSSNLYALR